MDSCNEQAGLSVRPVASYWRWKCSRSMVRLKTSREENPEIIVNVVSDLENLLEKELEQEQKLEIKINSRYAEIAPKATRQEDEDLRQDIENRGQLDPIKVSNNSGYVVDGHRRIPLLRELRKKPKIQYMDFGSPEEEELFVITNGFNRRNLNKFQRIELALKAKPIFEKIARKNMSLGGKGVKSFTPLKRVNDQIADLAQTSHMNVSKVENILQKGDPRYIERLRQGLDGTSISKVNNFIIEREAQEKDREEALRERERRPTNKPYELHHGDMREKGDLIPDNSVQLIPTDPPYDVPHLPLYGDAARLADRVLKPGGFLVVIVPHFALSTVTRIIEANSNLNYHWDIVIEHSGSSEMIRGMQVHHKIMLMYSKGKPTIYRRPMADVIKSRPPDKRYHEWAQSKEEAIHVIKHLTMPGQTVVDCFMGPGTFGQAVLEMGRYFIGIEKDKETFTIAENQLNDTQLGLEQLALTASIRNRIYEQLILQNSTSKNC